MAEQESRRRSAPGGAGEERQSGGRHEHEREERAGHRAPPPAMLSTEGWVTSGLLLGAGALLEPELLPGMVLGAGIVLAAGYASELFGGLMRPIVKGAVKAGYATASVMAEASERISDVVAEARSERMTSHSEG
jgi:hypothetical protein